MTAGSAPYRGNDRRGSASRQGVGLGRPFVVAGYGLVLVALVLVAGPAAGELTGVVNVGAAQALLDATAVAVAVVAGFLCLLLWRTSGLAAPMWIGAALLVLGLHALGLERLVPEMRPAGIDPEVLTAAYPAARLAALWMLYKALRTPEVDARLRLWPLLVSVTGLVAVLTIVFQLVPGLLPLLASAGDLAAAELPGTPLPLLLLGAWLAMGVAFGLRGIRTREGLFAWGALLLFALAFGELLRLQTPGVESVWAASANALRVIGLVFVLMGVTRELLQAVQREQDHLLEVAGSRAATTEAQLEATQRASEERAHEARNTLCAIEGNTHTLQQYGDEIDPQTRAELVDAVARGVARLQRLMGAEQVASPMREFDLGEAIAEVVAAPRFEGAAVEARVPREVVAYGRPAETQQVLQNLVDNARRYAPGSPIRIAAEPVRDGLAVRVQDEGPGIPDTEREAIFERGHRGTTSHTAEGSGLGLYVSRRLMREQGGELSYEPRPGGGSSFVLRLPARASSALPERPVDERDELVAAGNVTPLFGGRTPAAAVGSHREHVHRLEGHRAR